MAEFTVNTDGLRGIAGTMGGLQRELDDVALKLGAMQLGSILQIKATTAMIAQINDCRRAAANQADDLGNLARGLDDLAQLYDNYEKTLKEPKTQAEADRQKAAESQLEAEEDDSLFVDIAEFLNDLGWLGDIIGETVDAIWEHSGKVVSAIQRFFQNVEEFGGDLTDPRFWGEFVVETGVEIVKGAVIGVGVTAVVALVGVTGGTATALVVGGTVVVGWAIDGIYELITGEDGGITEAISDLIVDTGEKIIEGGKKIIDKAADAVEDVVDKAADAVEGAVEVVKDGAKAAWDGLVGFFT